MALSVDMGSKDRLLRQGAAEVLRQREGGLQEGDREPWNGIKRHGFAGTLLVRALKCFIKNLKEVSYYRLYHKASK